MATIPTGQLERELRKLYIQWVMGLSPNANMDNEIRSFQRRSEALIQRMGGQIARLGAYADFPAPRLLELSPYAGKVYDQMQLAAIRAGLATGINSRETARVMLRAGLDQSYRRLERLARTETVSAYWKNAFDSVRDLPDIVMLWGSEDGPRTCQWCRERDGLVMDSADLRDHPNGRCTPIPTLRSRVQYRGSISRDNQIYHDADWDRTTRPTPLQPVDVEPDGSFTSSWDIDSPDTAARAAAAEIERQRLFDLRNGLDRDTVDSLKYYVGSGYNNMNRYLRNPEGVRVSKSMARDLEGMDRAMEAGALTQETSLFRALTTYEGGWDPSSMRVGDMFADAAYLSTSTSREAIQEVIKQTGGDHTAWTFVIRAPAGTRAAAGSVYENEIILNRGSIQRVAKIDTENRIIYTEVQP